MEDTTKQPHDTARGIQAFLLLDLVVRLMIWAWALTLAASAMTALGAWPKKSLVGADFATARDWAFRLTWLIGLFNVCYVAVLVLLRLPIPTPREGIYRLAPGHALDRQLVWSCLIATLTKARYEAPFPGFLVFHVSSLPPLVWLFRPIVGPTSRSHGVSDTLFTDPRLIEIGRNVTLGLGSILSGHTQGRDFVEIKKTIIEDDVLIGGNAIIYGGCRVRRGAMVLGGAVVRPGTDIGENEVWGGVPAKRIKVLPPYGAPGSDAEA